MIMYSLHNAAAFDEELEGKYLTIAGRYNPEEMTVMASLLGMIVMALEENPSQDFLGQLFMEMELGSHWGGQYFTPYPVAALSAGLTLSDDARARMGTKGYIAMHEPAAGSGVMVIAALDTLRAQEIDFSKELFVEAWDVDITAVAMCYIQLTLLNVSAVIVHGNTLSMEVFRRYGTLAFHMHRHRFIQPKPDPFEGVRVRKRKRP